MLVLFFRDYFHFPRFVVSRADRHDFLVAHRRTVQPLYPHTRSNPAIKTHNPAVQSVLAIYRTLDSFGGADTAPAGEGPENIQPNYVTAVIQTVCVLSANLKNESMSILAGSYHGTV
jgi:hypothetical protein